MTSCKNPEIMVFMVRSVGQTTSKQLLKNACSLDGVRMDQSYAVLRRIFKTYQVARLSCSFPSTVAPYFFLSQYE